MNVVSFSGGKDSTAMLLMMLEKGIPVDRIVCIDTTKEFPQMYAHIREVQKMVNPLKIEVIKIDFDYWFGEYTRTKGKYTGIKGYGFPDFHNRWCTALKREAFRKTVYGGTRVKDIKNSDIVEFHGIAFDEPKRVHNRGAYKYVNIRRPLFEWGITENQALRYCYSKGLNWSGLYEKFKRVSCWMCPLSRIGELRTLYNDFPELWQKLREMDKKSCRKFRMDYSVDDLTGRFIKENLS